MKPTDPIPPSHPLVAVLDRVEAAFDDAGGLPVWTLDASCTAEVLTRLTALESWAAAAKLAVLAHSDVVDVGGPSGAPNTATWLAMTTRATKTDASAQTRLATSMESERHACVREALAAGALLVEQAKVIVHAVDELCREAEDVPAVDADVVARAEAWLVEQAAFHDAKTLRVLGMRLLDVAAPELADAFEAKRLEREEKRAAESTRLTMSDDGHGSVFVRAKLPAMHGAMLKKALLAFAAPKHQAATAAADGVPTPERKPSPERMGQAFCDLLESLQDVDLPKAGGTGATVVVTMTLDALTGGLTAAGLDTGEKLTASTARRLACQAGIIPAVLGTGSTSLDLGRQTRFHTKTQRIAIALRDGGCTADGCDWPPGMCATSTTTRPGAKEASPTSSTLGCSAPTTTPEPTTPTTTPPNSPTARSPSTGARRPARWGFEACRPGAPHTSATVRRWLRCEPASLETTHSSGTRPVRWLRCEPASLETTHRSAPSAG